MAAQETLVMGAVAAALRTDLFTMTDQKREAVVKRFLDWFAEDARLKPGLDLSDRIAQMEPKLRKMAKNLEVKLEGGKLIVRADADSTALLNLLRRGSSWFDPHPSVEAAILLALSKGNS